MHVLIKPVSGACNLRCAYCFYADEVASRAEPSLGRMDEETLEATVRGALSRGAREVTFGFQGGEPTLAGLPFFARAKVLAARYAPKGTRVNWTIQTNGVAIDDDWAAMLKRLGCLVGVSVDGPARIHDANRRDALGGGSFQRAMEGVERLRRHRVDFNVLTVVSAQVARNAERIYRFFMKNELPYQQYIPCLDPLMAERGLAAHSLTPELHAAFFTELFHLWYDDVSRGRFVYIRTFENYINAIRGIPPEHCGMLGRCAMQTVVEADGSVYPCDFYALDRYRLGNVRDGFDAIFARLCDSGFVEDSLRADAACADCRWAPICRGGCRRDRDYGGELRLNHYCEAYRAFFDYAMPGLVRLARGGYPPRARGLW